MNEVTRILSAIERGEAGAAEQLLPQVYEELRRLAADRIAHEKPGQTLQATALVHDAYLRLVDGDQARRWDSRGHFFAAAAEAMRRILVENARRKRRIRHGGELRRADVDVGEVAGPDADDEILALDEALQKLEVHDPVKAKLIQLRFFAGLTNDEAAKLVGISTATAKRYWRFARAWLHREVSGSKGTPAP